MTKYNRNFAFLHYQVLALMQDYVDQKEIGSELLKKVSKQLMEKGLLHMSTGALTFQALHDTGKGTAVLISRNLILTCAHNIYDKGRGYAYTDFKFYLAVHGDSSYYYEIEAYRFLEKQFAECNSRQRLRYQFALMKLKEDIERPIRLSYFLKFDLLCHECQTERFQLFIYGYSSYCSYQEQPVQTQSVQNESTLKIYQVGLSREGRLRKINFQEQSLQYQITTHSGQSGCAVASNDNIIGIHVGGGAGKSDFNIGRLITKEIIDVMRKWTDEMKADPFEIHQHSHQVKYENKKFIIRQQGSDKQQKVLEYNEHKYLAIQKILSRYFKNAKIYQCLMYKSTVLFPQDTLDKIQTEPLFSNQQITLRFIENSARLYFYRVVLKQYQNTSISDYNSLITLPNKETQNDYVGEVINFQSRYYYFSMNTALRAYDFSLNSEILQMATELINACSSLPKSLSTQVYRGVSKEFHNTLEEGQIIQFGEFLSTSKDRDEAYKHTLCTPGATLFKFSSTNGCLLGDNHECAGKKVIMHLPFSNFIVERVSNLGKVYQADLVEIPGPITYTKDIIVWICNRPTKCKTEWSVWSRSVKVEIIHVPSVRFFRDIWLPVYGWLLEWKQIRVRILLYENSENILDSLTRRLSHKQSLQEQNLGLMELLEYLRLEREDQTEILFYTDSPQEHAREAIQRGLHNNFSATSDVMYVNRFVQFSEQFFEDPSERRQ